MNTISSSIVIQGDCLTTMKTMPTDSVDLVCTDPPYGYSFMGKDWDKAVPSVEVWKECLRVLKPGAFAFVMSAPRQDVLSQMIVRLGEAGFDMSFSSIYWTYSSGFPKAHNIGKAVDKIKGLKGEEYVREDFVKRSNKQPQPQSQVINGIKGVYNKLVSEEAKALEGSYGGFQPKPAVEIIIVAMKPMTENTFTAQALSNGKGITWLDDCRMPYASESDEVVINTFDNGAKPFGDGVGEPYTGRIETKGRFPANLLVSDNVLDNGVVSKSQKRSGKYNKDNGQHDLYTPTKAIYTDNNTYDDKGQYSRYFSLDKWAEVNGIQPENNTFPFLICPKASKREKNAGCEELEDKEKPQRDDGQILINTPYKNRPGVTKNGHPTVKPIKLMSWLITLGSRENDIVLDPFAGSGTTLVAAKNLNRQYIGCEMSAEYCDIINARLSAVENKEEKKNEFFG